MWFDPRSTLFFLAVHFVVTRCQLPNLQPGDTAPSFALQTLNDRIVYKKSNSNSRTPTHPVIFHLFTRRSAFLEALWTNESSLQEFIEYSPGNTHYVFMSSSDSKSMEDILWLRKRLHRAIDDYFKRWAKTGNFIFWNTQNTQPITWFPRGGRVGPLLDLYRCRGHDPFGQHQESRPLAGTNLLNMRRVLVLYSQPIRFDG